MTSTPAAPATTKEGGEKMPRNNQKNSAKSNSNLFELLSKIEDNGTNEDEIRSATATGAGPSTCGRPLKRTRPYDPESPPRKKSVSTKASNSNMDQLLRIEALLKRVEEWAERAEKRMESLDEFIRNELFLRVASPTPAPEPTVPPPPPSPTSLGRRALLDIGLHLSHVQNKEIKEENAGVVRRGANEALKERRITCLGVNDKGSGRYRLLFKEADVDGLRRDDSWVTTHSPAATVQCQPPPVMQTLYYRLLIDLGLAKQLESMLVGTSHRPVQCSSS
jgi:hypothetical protein